MTIPSQDFDRRLLASWEANADAWTAAVREQKIASRRAGTDAAIVGACLALGASHVLDVGCGEGWLSRALAAEGRHVLGIDASAGLIERATAIRDAAGTAPTDVYEVIAYESLIADDQAARGPWPLIVCNFALLGDPLAPQLRALRQRLTADGSLLIQTVHPWMAVGNGAYTDGWREESFQGFGVAFPSTMPWYFRTVESWHRELTTAGLRIAEFYEPRNPESGQPLSMLLRCVL